MKKYLENKQNFDKKEANNNEKYTQEEEGANNKQISHKI